jgi:hypothetical protein
VREDIELALKCLRAGKVDARSVQLFATNTGRCVRLDPPRIVSAYAYGLYAGGGYYTMELLDGIDVREAPPSFEGLPMYAIALPSGLGGRARCSRAQA